LRQDLKKKSIVAEGIIVIVISGGDKGYKPLEENVQRFILHKRL
jgi:hypothetical protein